MRVDALMMMIVGAKVVGLLCSIAIARVVCGFVGNGVGVVVRDDGVVVKLL